MGRSLVLHCNIELVNTIYYWSGHAPVVQYSTPNELSGLYRQFSTIRRTSGEWTTSGDCQLHFHGLSPVHLTERCGGRPSILCTFPVLSISISWSEVTACADVNTEI